MKPIPQRPSKLDPHRSEIDGWLDSEPAITAVEVLARLRARYPDRFRHRLAGVQRVEPVEPRRSRTRLTVAGEMPTSAAIASPVQRCRRYAATRSTISAGVGL